MSLTNENVNKHIKTDVAAVFKTAEYFMKSISFDDNEIFNPKSKSIDTNRAIPINTNPESQLCRLSKRVSQYNSLIL